MYERTHECMMMLQPNDQAAFNSITLTLSPTDVGGVVTGFHSN